MGTVSDDVRASVRSYVDRVVTLLTSLDIDALGRVVELLEEARRTGRNVYLAGNGGSSATAAHWANDLNKATKLDGTPSMRVVNLTDNVPWLTALANDEGYERIFAGQIDNLGTPGDLLVVLSVSGNSPNLVAAVRLAQSRGVKTAALLGFDGGVLRELVDEPLVVETEHGAYGLAESCHSLVCDMITEWMIASAPAAAGASR